MFRKAAVLSFLLIASSLCLPAQSPLYEPPQRPGGPHFASQGMPSSLYGTVLTADNRPLRDVRVDLRDGNGATLNSVYTNISGMFEFSQVASGSYEVVAVSGLAEARQRVDMGNMPSGLSLRIPVQSTPNDGNQGNSVSVAQFKVPAKSRDEFKSAQEASAIGNLDEAQKHIAKALAAYPKYADALTLRAILKMDLNDRQGALADLQEAIQDDQNCPMAYIVMGAVLNTEGKFDDAIRTLERGEALSPNSWQAYFELGKAFTAKGQYEEALRQLNKAQALAPKDYPPLHLVKARAMMGLNDYSGEMTELQQYLDKEPQGAHSAVARQMLDQARAFAQTGQRVGPGNK